MLKVRPWSRLLRLERTRRFATAASSTIDITKIPLSEPLPVTAKLAAAATSYKPFDTRITVLPSGLRVASEELPGAFCTIGVLIESGCRFESYYPYGVSHLIEKLAFGQTTSNTDVQGVLDAQGALVDCQSTRDTVVYASSCLREGLRPILKLIGDTALRPVLSDEELEVARQIILFENEDLSKKPECEPLITDFFHSAAFRGNTLGFSKFTPNESLEELDRKTLFTYLSQYHDPKRMVVAGVGVEHDELVSAASEYFAEGSAIWNLEQLANSEPPPIDKSLAQYTGGQVRVQKDLKSFIEVGASPYPNLAHFALGFETVGYRHEDFIACCVLQALMGGGGSFSAGGPGKGMYTRLYVDVLNRCHWMHAATAYNHSYADAGVFHIQAACDPADIDKTATVILSEFLRLSEGVEKEELDRAKTQLKSQLMMNLELRPVQFEDLGRQVLGHGTRRKPEEYMSLIDQVQEPDLKRVAERMLSGKPSVVGYGEIEALPSYEAFERAVAKKSLRELAAKKMFSFV